MTLDALIADWRTHLRDEVPHRLHQRGDTANAGHSREGWTGLPFTPEFLRYLGHWEERAKGYEFIAASAFEAVADNCRINHDESHRAGGPTASLCKRIAVAVVELRQPLTHVAEQEGITPSLAHHFLREALTVSADYRRRRMDVASQLDSEAANSESRPLLEQHLEAAHAEHAEKVYERLRMSGRWQVDGEPIMPPWEVEQDRLIEWGRRVGCPQCLEDAA